MLRWERAAVDPSIRFQDLSSSGLKIFSVSFVSLRGMNDSEDTRPFGSTAEAMEVLCYVLAVTAEVNGLLLQDGDPNCVETELEGKEGSIAQKKLKELDALREDYEKRYQLTAELAPSLPLVMLVQENDLSITERRIFQTTLALICRTTHRFAPSATVGLVSRLVAGWNREKAQSLLRCFVSGSRLVDCGLIDVIQCRPTVADWVVRIPSYLLMNLLGSRQEWGVMRPLPSGLQVTLRRLSTSIPPILLLPRLNAVAHAFKKERFAILSAFESGLQLETNLHLQSTLVDAVKEAGFNWFPVVFDWCGEVRRSIFVHKMTMAEARQRNLHSRHARLQAPELTMEAVLRLRGRCGLGSFILGERGTFLVYDGEPALPAGTGDELQLNVDADFLAFRQARTPGDRDPRKEQPSPDSGP